MAYLVFFFRIFVLAVLPAISVADTNNREAPVLLVVEVPDNLGGIAESVEFTMEDLQKMPMVGFETETIWFTGTQHFAGVPLMELLEDMGVTEGTLTVSASDGYSIETEMSLAVEYGAIVAYARNGAPMSVRRKGPLRLVYDYDKFPPLIRDSLFTNSIWQVTQILVGPESGEEGLDR